MRLKLHRPFLAAVKHGYQFQTLASDAVGDDEGGVRHYELPCAKHAAWAAHLWVCLKKVYRLKHTARDESCILLRISFDVLAQMNEVADRPAGPDDFHFGAFVSPGLPQDFSHFETFS